MRSRSHSRISNVTDKGQISASLEDLNHLAPPNPNLADATRCAPERKASPLPSPTSEISSPGISAAVTPGIVIEDLSRPQSPETLIPPTDTLSTRPTRGGIAYPFSLKVEGEGREVNASTITLQSVSVQDGEGIASAVASSSPLVETEKKADIKAPDEKVDRPPVERFVTAAPGELTPTDNVGKGKGKEEEKLERPGVERFETAQEDLNALTNGTKV